MAMDRIEFALKSFASNRQVAERNLAEMREYARRMLDYRHGRWGRNNPIWRMIAPIIYIWEKRRLMPLLRETRWKVQFYRKVEADLTRGDLGSAIEALSFFAPREETDAETVRRVRTSPATVWAIQRSPHIMRDDLLQIQQKQTS